MIYSEFVSTLGIKGSIEPRMANYIARNLDLCQTEEVKRFMFGKLRDFIVSIVNAGLASQLNWDQQPLIRIPRSVLMSHEGSEGIEKIKKEVIQSREKEKSFGKLADANKVVGRSTEMEKHYLRLTGDPDPSTIRPLSVLEKSLKYCMNKYRQNNDYVYIAEQLRSIRQDLTVQHIYNDFCVEVYQTHIKLALESGDWDNFIQVQTPLEELYKRGLGTFKDRCTFTCYRMLYLISVDDYPGLIGCISELDQDLFNSRDVQFAIRLWNLVMNKEWITFFEMFSLSSSYCKKAISLKIESFRDDALLTIAKCYRKLRLEDYRVLLCLDTDKETEEFLKAHDIQLSAKSQ